VYTIYLTHGIVPKLAVTGDSVFLPVLVVLVWVFAVIIDPVRRRLMLLLTDHIRRNFVVGVLLSCSLLDLKFAF
jgi:hypothetical protein